MRMERRNAGVKRPCLCGAAVRNIGITRFMDNKVRLEKSKHQHCIDRQHLEEFPRAVGQKSILRATSTMTEQCIRNTIQHKTYTVLLPFSARNPRKSIWHEGCGTNQCRCNNRKEAK